MAHPRPDSGVPAVPDASVPVPDAGTPPVPDAGPPPIPDAGPPPDPCVSVQCAAGSYCVAGTCLVGDPGDPALHTQAQVCDAWAAGHVVTDNSPFSKSQTTCDPGTLSPMGIGDALTRLAMHRYLAGLGPVMHDGPSDNDAQQCALISAWNPAGPSAHFPQPTATCYSQGGAAAAGSSNIAWGPGDPAGAIDQWMEDFGNETTFGHRRWLLNPPLGPVGFGFYEGGNNYGSASCIEVFGSSGSGPSRAFIAWPPPGFVPTDIAQMTWTVQGDIPTANVTVAITDGTGQTLDSTATLLDGNYGFSDAVRIDRNGWSPAAGQTYHVTLSGDGHAPLSYDVKPVACATN
jgi:hypothetical protein